MIVLHSVNSLTYLIGPLSNQHLVHIQHSGSDPVAQSVLRFARVERDQVPGISLKPDVSIGAFQAHVAHVFAIYPMTEIVDLAVSRFLELDEFVLKQ